MMVFGLFVPSSSLKQKIENLPHRAAQVYLSRNCRFPGATGSHLSETPHQNGRSRLQHEL